MNGWLLDTNVVSEWRKISIDPHVKLWTDTQPQDSFFLSDVSFAEIRFGIERTKNDTRRRELTQWLAAKLRPWFTGRVLDISEDTLLNWRRMMEASRVTGNPIGEPDLLIAAMAQEHNLCVATRNTGEFARAGVPVFNPWTNVLEMPGRKPAKMNGVMTLDRVR